MHIKNDQTRAGRKSGQRKDPFETTRFAGTLSLQQDTAAEENVAISLTRCWHVDAQSGYDINRDIDGFCLLIRTIKGHGIIELPRQSIHIHKGQWTVIHSEKNIRYFCSSKNWESWQFQFQAHGQIGIPSGQCLESTTTAKDQSNIDDIFYYIRHADHYAQKIASSKFSCLMYEWAHRWKTSEPGSHNTQLIQKIINHMHESLLSGVSISSLAQEANLSEPHFRRVFRKEIGVSPKQYYDELRILGAEEDLIAGASLKEVANRYNYSSVFHFSSTFKKHRGISPSQIKK